MERNCKLMPSSSEAMFSPCRAEKTMKILSVYASVCILSGGEDEG